MFICNHCPYVKAVIKDIVNDANNLKNLNVNTIAIMSNDTKNYPDDSFENMIKFSKINKFNFPYLFDETQEIAKNMGLYVLQIFLDTTINLELQYRGSN